MSTRVRQAFQSAAGAGGEALNVEDVFSTYLYTGNSSTQTITNGIDLAGEGGLVWMQVRNVLGGNRLVDSENGNNYLRTHNTSGLTAIGSPAFTLNANGFTVPNGATAWNANGDDIASWTFRKAPKFFDVVTWTGDGNSGRQISHNLGSAPAVIIIKSLNFTNNWLYNTNFGASSYDLLYLDTTLAASSQNYSTGAIQSAPTDSTFTLKNSSSVNGSGNTYVAYLFAHNDGDGEFGPDGDADIIKCGSFTVSSSGWSVDLGWEPQWVMIKKTSGTSNWGIVDNMRSWDTLSGTGDNATQLRANLTNAENRETYPRITSTGFNHEGAAGWLTNGEQYIYMAIRRGPMAVPESATEVFDIDLSGSTAPRFESSFPVDMAFWRPTVASQTKIASRLTGKKSLLTNDNSSEDSANANVWDFMDGFYDGGITSTYAWMWKRAPGFFDVVTYSGNDTARTIQHNLGAVPEMIWVKKRSSTSNWSVLHSGLNTAGNEYIKLNNSNAKDSNVQIWNGTVPTDTVFSVGTSDQVNHSYLSATYIAYLFASLDGVSKLGSYTGNGSSQTIDCGFTSGARFVLLKRTDSAGDWMVYDSTRGITSTSNDPGLGLNNTDAEFTESAYFGADVIRPDSSGFIIDNYFASNGHTYIFYAIA